MRNLPLMVIVLALLCCNLGSATPSFAPTVTPPPNTAIDKSYQDQWVSLAPGLEARLYVPEGNAFVQMWALRIDPAHYTFRAHYRPGQPLTLDQWRNSLPGAVVFVNANLFSRQAEVVGLLVADGAAYGASYRGYGGMFQVQDGLTRVRSLAFEPYRGEPLQQAVQGYPMLVLDGAPAYAGTRRDRPSRRTVVGQDSSGRIILMATPLLGLALSDLSAYLAATDMELVTAFNLDGGGSTMMYIAESEPPLAISSFDAVPSMLAVYPK